MIRWGFNMKKKFLLDYKLDVRRQCRGLSVLWGRGVLGCTQGSGLESWENTCASSSLLTTVFVTRPWISNGICPNLESPVKNDQDNWILKIVVLEWWVRSQEGYDSGWCKNCSFKCLKGAKRKMGYLSSLWLQRVEFWPGGRIIETFILTSRKGSHF